MCANKLSVNSTKTKAMLFQRPRTRYHCLRIYLNNQLLEFVDNFKFLGLTLKKDLSWSGHLDEVSGKISKILGILKRVKGFLPRTAMLNIYNSLIGSHIHFHILSWGRESEAFLRLQKRAMRIICSKHFRHHSDPLFVELNVLKCSDLYCLGLLKFYKKLLLNQVPAYFHDLDFTMNANRHDFFLRDNDELEIPFFERDYLQKHSITYNVVSVYNDLTDPILNIFQNKSVQCFGKHFKSEALGKYNLVCLDPDCYSCN